MITVRKLLSLKEGTRQRKIIKILSQWELDLRQNTYPDLLYFKEFLRALEAEKALEPATNPVPEIWRLLEKDPPRPDARTLLFQINSLRHLFMDSLGISPADWDLLNPEDRGKGEGRRFPFSLYLDELRSPFNVGSVFRTAECLGVSQIYLSPGTADPGHPRARRTSMGCTEHISWRRMDYDELGCMEEDIFAMELGGATLSEFKFPGKGILVLGSEELGVSPQCLSLADQRGGLVSIELYGSKASLNVSVAFGIVMNAWAASLS